MITSLLMLMLLLDLEGENVVVLEVPLWRRHNAVAASMTS